MRSADRFVGGNCLSSFTNSAFLFIQMRLLLSAWDGECLTKQQLVSAYVSVQCSVQMAEYTGIDQYGKHAANGFFPVDTCY